MSAARKLKPAPAELPFAVVVKEELAAALALPASIVDRRPTIPILACVRLEQRLGELHLAATDMDIAVETRCPLREHDWGEGKGVAVDAGLLKAVVAAAPKGGEIRLAVGPNGLLVSHSLERARLPVLPADEFPTGTDPEGVAVAIEVAGDQLSAALGRVAAAINREETRYYLGGVYLEVKRHHVELTATDGHRLHHARLAPLDMDHCGVTARAVIVPRRMVELLAQAAGPLTLSVHERGVVAAGGLGRITSRVIDGQFPDWRRIVPDAKPDGVEFSGGDVAEAVKRLRGFGDGALHVRLEAERLTLQGSSEDGEIAETSVAGTAVGGPGELETGLKGRYLLEAAQAVGGTMRWSWAGASAPMRIDCPERQEELIVLMPMRMGGWREVE
jgi:DNA polymerase III subunit beta